MFDHTAVRTDGFPDGLLHQALSPVEYQLLDPESTAHTTFLAHWDEFLQKCTIAARGTEVVTGSSSSSASTASPTAQPFLEEWAKLQTSSPSAIAAKEDQTMKDQVLNSFRLLFGRLKEKKFDNGTTKTEFAPAELSDQFKTLLGMKSGSRATLYFQNAFRQFTQSLDHMNYYERNFEFDIRVCQHAFVAAVQNFRFLTSSLNLTPEDIGNGLCLFHFLPPQSGCVSYKTMLEDNHTITLQEQMGEDKSKIEKKSSVLYYGGRIATVSDFHKTIATFMVFMSFAIKDFKYSEMPLLGKWLHKYASVLTRGGPLQWINKHSGITHLPASLLIDANSILQGCVELATNFKVINLLAQGDHISPSLWESVQQLADTTCTTLSNAIYSGTLGCFRERPMLMDYLVMPSIPKATDSSSSSRKRSADTPTASKDKDSKKSKNSDSTDIIPGLLMWTGSGSRTPIPPNLKMMCSVTNKESRLCAKWLYQGQTCPHGRDCRMAHLNRVEHLDVDNQKILNQWVHAQEHVEFTKKQSRVVVPQPRAYLSTAVAPVQTTIDRGISVDSPALPGAPAGSSVSCHEPVPMLIERLPPPSSRIDAEIKFSDTKYPQLLENEAELTASFESLVVQGEDSVKPMTAKQRREWARVTLPSPVYLSLNKQYGKDSIERCFTTERRFRHTWIFLFKRDYLDPDDLREIFLAFPHALLLWRLLRQHEFIDFRPLQAPIPSDLPPAVAMHRWSAMFTACLLHYDLHVPSAVRFVGNIHTGEHRHWDTLQELLTKAQVEKELVANLKRVFVAGSPNFVNAESTDANYHSFLAYGNHSTILEDVEKTKSTIQKDFMRSYTLTANPLLTFFLADCHLTPIGLVDLNKKYKNPRIIFDSTFRPMAWSMAINDFTVKTTEPPIKFAKSFERFLQWIYNLRRTYPRLEIYICDDDVSGAFRHGKWNPNIVGMHCYRAFGFLFLCTGLTFGDNTSPPQWETVALTRQQLAQYFWGLADTVSRVREYMPSITTAPMPTPEEADAFVPADPDPLYPGVLNPDGSRKPPTFDHHVDDNLYADIGLYLIQGIAASVLALYSLLGFPNPAKGIRDCVSWEKFQSLFSHKRKTVGFIIDSRRLTVTLPDYKRDRLVESLSDVLDDPRLSIRQIAELLGQLGSATTVCRWMRCSYFNLEFFLRQILRRHYLAIAKPASRKRIKLKIEAQLPADFRHRLESLLSKEMARVLWNSRHIYLLDQGCLSELRTIRSSLLSEPWEIFIPQAIPRTVQFTSDGDASEEAGGAFSPSLFYWFRVFWSERILAGIKLPQSHPDFIHINCLEFVVAILQFAAAIVRCEQRGLPPTLEAMFPDGLPAFPVVLTKTDNTTTEAWYNNGKTKSVLARDLVLIYGLLLRRTRIVPASDWLAGVKNIVPDWLSHVSEISLSEHLRHFPTESRAVLRNPVMSLLQAISGPPVDPKQFGTLLSRRIHYFMFVYDMKLDDDLLLQRCRPERRALQFGLYAAHLATGKTLRGQYIKADTIKAYLRAAASFLFRFTGIDPRYDKPGDKSMSKYIHAILTEVERHEGMKDKVEPYTTALQQHLEDLNIKHAVHDDSLWAALEDWFSNGLQTGNRLSEWAQRKSTSFPDGYATEKEVATAFTARDIRCMDVNRAKVSLSAFLSAPDSVERIGLTWSHQKNGNHGEERLFKRNRKNPRRCPIRRFHSILCRFDRLVGIANVDIPLAVYRDTGGKIQFVTEDVITKVMRALAVDVYKLDPENDKIRYSSHSLRVGACVMLHANGFSTDQIKFLLRWKSDAFMEYLRNVALLCDKQNETVNVFDHMPNLI